MKPGNLCSSLLHNLLVWVSLGKCSHVFQIADPDLREADGWQAARGRLKPLPGLRQSQALARDRVDNQNFYRSGAIARHYGQLAAMQPAEQAILEMLRPQLSQMTMLDIGVGGGRTTGHFAPLVAQYDAIDYSPEMIAQCRQRFASAPPAWRFEVGDARQLKQFCDRSFDFILFSFNGIDYVSQSDRLQVLQEIHRIGKPGGYFGFSSHNLLYLEQAFDIRRQIQLNPLSSYVNLVMWAILRLVNRPLTAADLNRSAYALVRDDSHNFRLSTYYSRPQAQLLQLAPYFEDIQVFAWNSSVAITNPTKLSDHRAQWLYYLCRFK
jgi:ubiquinone/menaquinone biosynthesis C-methylase UbiE